MTHVAAPPRPPYDAELAAALPAVNQVLPSSITPEDLPQVRQAAAVAFLPISEVVGDRPISYEDRVIPGAGGPLVHAHARRRCRHSHPLARAHPGLRRPPVRRGQDQGRDHAVPQALPRQTGLSLPTARQAAATSHPTRPRSPTSCRLTGHRSTGTAARPAHPRLGPLRHRLPDRPAVPGDAARRLPKPAGVRVVEGYRLGARRPEDVKPV